VLATWELYGADAIRRMAEDDPGGYVRAVVSMLPRDDEPKATLIDAALGVADNFETLLTPQAAKLLCERRGMVTEPLPAEKQLDDALDI